MPASDPTKRYVLYEELGAGTSAVVYRSFDRVLGRDVALKLLHRDLAPDAGRRLQREAKVAAAFRHRNAVEVYEVGVLDERPFLAMELVRGGTLAQHLQRAGGAAGAQAATAIGIALAEVLAAAHDVGLVHRDVKPSNVFIEGELAAPRRVRLVDFGLAFSLAPDSNTLGRLTKEGFLLGTPAYMAPEQADGRPIGPPADIYALGCMLYELVSGRTPFLGDIPRMLAGHLYLPPIPLDELDLLEPPPTCVGREIARMLAKDPAERPTAGEVRDHLRVDDNAQKRATADRPRSERSITAPPLEPTAAQVLRVAVGDLDAGDTAVLRDAGLATASIDDAELVLVRLDDGGGFADAFRGKPVVGVHPAPTPKLIASAIRHEVLLVLRSPLATDGLAPRLQALARSRQLTRE